MEELKGWMHQLVADMQTSILGRISDIEQNIQSLLDRVSSLERQNEAVDVLQQADETATAAIPHQSPRHTRTRKAPTEIQASGLWEKRCQVLKDDEKQLWGDIKPTMMSEEESDDQNAQTLQRRRPSWRSDRLNDFIDDLDERINGTSNSKLHPKKQGIEGPLLDASTPPTAQPWMIREKA
ncbi:hypothetical protein EMCRGX_G019106 [Ephydatia muelleri]